MVLRDHDWIKVVLWVQTDSKYCIIDMLACVGQEGDVVNDQSFMLKIDPANNLVDAHWHSWAKHILQ